MPDNKFIRLFSINPAKLQEEIRSAISVMPEGIGFHGFDYNRENLRLSRVSAGPTPVTSNDNADPGEVRVRTTAALSIFDNTALMNAIAGHDETDLTAEQVREDTDVVQLANAVAGLDRAAWDLKTDSDKSELLRRCVMLLFRENLSYNFSTDS